jgi:protein-L-isoaspartate(D-aspartate) O-methyltransferase
MTDFAHARRLMVDNQLRTSGITDRRLLAAMGEVPREQFVPEARRALAYIDDSQPLSASRRLGAPAPFARLVQLAAVQHTDRVLDLGSATGYSVAVLAHLADEVVGIEPDPALAARGRTALAALGVRNATIVDGPLDSAAKAHGSFDVIVVEGVLDAAPDWLFGQLKPDGRLVALVAEGRRPPVAHLYARSGKGIAARAEFDARLPPIQREADDRFVF